MKKGWTTARFGDLGRVFNGNSIGENEKKARYVGVEKGVPYIGTKDVGFDSQIRYDSGVKIPPSRQDRFKLAPTNSVLVCAEGGSAGRKIAHTDLPIFFGNKLFAICPKPETSSRFVFYYCLSDDFADAFRGSMAGLIGGVSLNKFKALEIKLPPLSEQKRIVCVLDEAFAELTTAQANAEKNLQNARALFESYLQSVFTHRGEGWLETTLDKISTNLDSKRVPITKSVRSSGEYPYYGASGIVDYVADYIFEGNNLLISEDGANLLARSTPIAFSVSGKYWVNNHAHVLHFETMSTQRFVEFYLENIKLDEYVTGAAQPKLNQKALNSIPIPIPKSLAEQARIVASVETLQEETQNLARIYEQKQASLAELKKSLLHQAFSGQL